MLDMMAVEIIISLYSLYKDDDCDCVDEDDDGGDDCSGSIEWTLASRLLPNAF